MSTYTQIIYQIVFSTKHRNPALVKPQRKDLFRYIWGIFTNHNCHLYRINGVDDHLHILTHLHPTVALSDLIKTIKVGSNSYIKKQQLFPEFRGWQDGYAAFTYTVKEKERLTRYVKNQEEHHRATSFKEELVDLLKEHDVVFDKKYLL